MTVPASRMYTMDVVPVTKYAVRCCYAGDAKDGDEQGGIELMGEFGAYEDAARVLKALENNRPVSRLPTTA